MKSRSARSTTSPLWTCVSSRPTSRAASARCSTVHGQPSRATDRYFCWNYCPVLTRTLAPIRRGYARVSATTPSSSSMARKSRRCPPSPLSARIPVGEPTSRRETCCSCRDESCAHLMVAVGDHCTLPHANNGKEWSEMDVADLRRLRGWAKQSRKPAIFSAATLRKFGRDRWNSGDLIDSVKRSHSGRRENVNGPARKHGSGLCAKSPHMRRDGMGFERIDARPFFDDDESMRS